MSSHDIRRINPGIQVNFLFPEIVTDVNPRMVPATSAASLIGVVSNVMPSSGSNPNFAYALNSSGSFVKLVP
jgi:hypothetical protein